MIFYALVKLFHNITMGLKEREKMEVLIFLELLKPLVKTFGIFWPLWINLQMY